MFIFVSKIGLGRDYPTIIGEKLSLQHLVLRFSLVLSIGVGSKLFSMGLE